MPNGAEVGILAFNDRQIWVARMTAIADQTTRFLVWNFAYPIQLRMGSKITVQVKHLGYVDLPVQVFLAFAGRTELYDEFCQAVALWLGRRFKLPRPVDPASEVLVLNGSREGLFLGAIAAKRWVNGRAGRPAVLLPNPFYGAYSAGARFEERIVTALHRRAIAGWTD